MNRLDFVGRRAVVTGGSSGIGLAVARRLLLGGASVVIWSRSPPQQLDALRGLYDCGLVSGAIVDVRRVPDVVRAARDALTAGPVDILVNNAGEFGAMKRPLDYSVAEWEAIIEANLTSQFSVCREIVPHMVARGYGRVVNLSSVVGRDANPAALAYSAAKAGVIRFTQGLGRDLAKTGVLVNCVAPSAIGGPALFDGIPHAQVDAMVAKVPMGRLGTVEEVAELVCWLASEGCSYCTGAVFDCSGGRHE